MIERMIVYAGENLDWIEVNGMPRFTEDRVLTFTTAPSSKRVSPGSDVAPGCSHERTQEPAWRPAPVFVYGTLLAGEPNHRLLARARIVSEARTRPTFELRDLGAFPGLVRGGAHAVAGEVYEVDEPTLAALDRLEGHPRFYRRTRIALEDGALVETYLLAPEQVEGRPVIHSGSWRARRKETAA